MHVLTQGAHLSVSRSFWPRRAKTRVLIVNGHPDARPERYCAALCAAFAEGAIQAGKCVRYMSTGDETLFANVETAMEHMWWAESLFVAFPLWLDRPPPTLRRLFEEFSQQVDASDVPSALKETRLVVTASLPSLLYRTSRAKGEPRTCIPLLRGMTPAGTTIIGSVDTISTADRQRWLTRIHRMGASKRVGAVQ